MSAFVYVISDGEFMKVGRASDVQARLRALQTGNARKLAIAAVREVSDDRAASKLESHIHRTLADDRVGGEWFKANLETIRPLLDGDLPAEVARESVSLEIVPSEAVVHKMGGHRAVSDFLNVDVSRVHRWGYPKDRGGSAGRIPQKYVVPLINHAEEIGVDLSVDDFFPEYARADARAA